MCYNLLSSIGIRFSAFDQIIIIKSNASSYSCRRSVSCVYFALKYILGRILIYFIARIWILRLIVNILILIFFFYFFYLVFVYKCNVNFYISPIYLLNIYIQFIVIFTTLWVDFATGTMWIWRPGQGFDNGPSLSILILIFYI